MLFCLSVVLNVFSNLFAVWKQENTRVKRFCVRVTLARVALVAIACVIMLRAISNLFNSFYTPCIIKRQCYTFYGWKPFDNLQNFYYLLFQWELTSFWKQFKSFNMLPGDCAIYFCEVQLFLLQWNMKLFFMYCPIDSSPDTIAANLQRFSGVRFKQRLLFRQSAECQNHQVTCH